MAKFDGGNVVIGSKKYRKQPHARMRSDLINAGGAPHVLGKGTGPALGSYAVSGVAEVRYIAKPTIAEALVSYRRAAELARPRLDTHPKPPFVRDLSPG